MAKTIDLKSESGENIMSFGGLGPEVITATATATNHYGALTALEASVVSFTNNMPHGDASMSSLAVPAGITLVGDMSAVVVASGTMYGYLKEVE